MTDDCSAAPPAPGGPRSERGSVLMLVPAGLLIVLIMASIAIDMSLVQLRQRQAHDLASGAANDAVTAAADHDALRASRYDVDLEAAATVATRIVAASDLAPHVVGTPAVRATAEGVEVEVTLYADYIFAGVVPGAPDGTTVTAAATATAQTP